MFLSLYFLDKKHSAPVCGQCVAETRGADGLVIDLYHIHFQTRNTVSGHCVAEQKMVRGLSISDWSADDAVDHSHLNFWTTVLL